MFKIINWLFGKSDIEEIEEIDNIVFDIKNNSRILFTNKNNDSTIYLQDNLF